MNRLCLTGLAGLASLGAHAQDASLASQTFVDSVVVTATRALNPATTLRDAIVITREDLDHAGAASLGEVLQRRAGIELRATGGPGQPQTLFIRGAGSAQTLVLVDGLRVGSATIGTTSIEHIPLDMIERIEVVKGPLSSLYGPEAIGGVIQIFTRGKSVPYFFASAAVGTDRDERVSTGLTTEDAGTAVSLTAGMRRVNARSATNDRAGFVFNPDRDPHENAFFSVRASQKMWQGEILELDAFTSRSRTRFDGGPSDDTNTQQVSGVKFSSASAFTTWWTSRLAIGQGRDRLVTRGGFANFLETRQDQGSWVNEITMPVGILTMGAETLRQNVTSDEAVTRFEKARRDTNSVFVGITESNAGQRLEASARRDDDDQFGKRNTGAASFGSEWPGVARLAVTYARGFRAPTFFDLYASFPGYTPNPALLPEQSRSREISVKSFAGAPLQWRITGFDHRLENLIVFSASAGTVLNVARARARGIEAAIDANWLGARWRVSFTAQRPRDEDTGLALQGRAERFGSAEVSRDWGPWSVGVSVLASGARFDSAGEIPASRLGGYAVVDARVRYAIDRRWSVELAATNLGDRKYESAVGYDAPRRSVLLSLRFESY